MSDASLTLRVEKISSHGEGIAFSEGKAVFIPFTIPGERVHCEPVETHTQFMRARLIDILEPSPHRIEPPCPLFGICGGCALQHVEYPYQIELKRQAAYETFSRIGGFDPGVLEMVQGAPYHYRNRTQVHACDDGGLGFTRAGSRETVRTRACPTLVPVLESWMIAQNRKARPYRELAALIGERRRFTAFAQDAQVFIEGQDAFAEAVLAGHRFRFPVAHFFQSNLSVLERLLARHILTLEGDAALDLYAGAGLFAAFLAERFASVNLVESDPVSLEAARSNVRGTARIRISDMPVETWIKSPLARQHHDVIVADPPRTGMTPEVRAWLAGANAQTLVYVSCDHASLARDLKHLRATWKLVQLVLYDFYPQTGRLEAVAVLRKEHAAGRGHDVSAR